MAFANDTNRGRVQKMLDLLGLIEKSAQSNSAAQEDLAEMLAPLIERLTGAGLLATEPPEAARPVCRNGRPSGRWPKRLIFGT